RLKKMQINDPLEEILQKKTPEERFLIKTCSFGNTFQPKCEYYEHTYNTCRRLGGLCLHVSGI
ncbi:MAG: hypothetical protein QXK37_06280, partial [Candidatus Woesearchaeota archaeon]